MGICKSRPDLIDTNFTTSQQNNNVRTSDHITVERSDLFDAIKRRDWDEARALLRRSDACALVDYIYTYNMNALHRACQRKAPSDIIQAMIDTSTKAPLEQDTGGCTPLHWAIIINSSEDIIITLLGACPRAASIADNWGRKPLHLATSSPSSNVIRCLLATNPTAAAATNHDGCTPLRLLFKFWNFPLRDSLGSFNGDRNMTDVILRNEIGQEKRIGEIHQTFLLLLEAATHGSIEKNQDSQIWPLHAAINDPRCPWSFVHMILRMNPKEAFQWDREEKLPIHVAAAATSSGDGELYKCDGCECSLQNSSWYVNKENYGIYCHECFQKYYEARKGEFKLMNSVDKIPAVIEDLLAMNSTFAGIPDSEGRLPLHIAIENEKSFKPDLETIFEAAPEALSARDIKTHLYPFMLGALEHNRETNTLQKFTSCFTLLTENPCLVSSGIPH